MSYVISALVAALATVSGLFGVHHHNTVPEVPQSTPVPVLGSDTVRTVGAQSYTLAGAGVSSSGNTITLTSLTIPQTGYELVDSDFSNTFYVTLEPGSRTRQEFASCTTVTQNTDDTATLSGCVRGLLPFSPYTASSSYRFSHSGGTSLIFSNPPQLYEQAAFKDNDETITGQWEGPTPLTNGAFATKGYVDSVVTGTTTLTNAALVLNGAAGESVATGSILYFDTTAGKWLKASASTTASSTRVQLGISQGTASAGATIPNGVLGRGYVTQFGGTAGQVIYLSNTAGATSTTPGTVLVVLGQAKDASTMYFDPIYANYASLAGTSTFTGTVSFATSTTVNGISLASTTVYTFDASGTFTKPTNVGTMAFIEAWGGGGSGASLAAHGASGGGGGGYAWTIKRLADLSATTSVTVGAGGAAVSSADGNAGASSSLGSLITAYGGGAGVRCVDDTNDFPASGGGGGGPLGQGGSGAPNGSSSAGSPGAPLAGVGTANNSQGGSGYVGGGAGGGCTASNSAGAGGNSFYGGGGGGGASTATGTGGTSVFGGNGGAGALAATAATGTTPGGGGGASDGGTSGAGGGGRVRITVF